MTDIRIPVQLNKTLDELETHVDEVLGFAIPYEDVENYFISNIIEDGKEYVLVEYVSGDVLDDVRDALHGANIVFEELED